LNRVDKTYKYEFWWEKISRYATLPAILISSLLVSIINISSLLPFVYFLVVSIFLYAIIFKKVHAEVILLYGLYSLITIILYLVQYATLPEYYGFSGGLGIGTDDCRHFVASANQLTKFYPENCYAHLQYGIPNYSNFLNLFTPFKITHVFDVVFVNVIASVFLPIFTREVYREFLNNTGYFYAFIFAAICPFIVSNSLVLVRDGLTATLLIGSVYFILKNKYVFLIISLVLLFYIRIASGAMAMLIITFFGLYVYHKHKSDKYTSPVLLIVILIVSSISVLIALPFVYDYMVSKHLVDSLFREEFLLGYFIEGGSGRESSALVKMMTLPAFLRIPLSTVFFLVLPLFSPSDIIREGIFIPRSFLMSFIFPLLFLFYIKVFINSLIYSVRNLEKKVILLFIIYLLSILILSQMSLQPRHKTMVMPLFYIIAASGMVYKDKLGQQISTVLLVLFIVGQLFLIAVL